MLPPLGPIYCRPIRLQYQNETSELIKREQKHIMDQFTKIKSEPISIPINKTSFVNLAMEYDLRLTMVDGKAINALLDTSLTLSCNLCGANPSQMNFIRANKRHKGTRHLIWGFDTALLNSLL